MYSKYTKVSFDELWPFKVPVGQLQDELLTEDYCTICKGEMSIQKFQEKTKNEFNNFVDEILANRVDLFSIIFSWLKCVSRYWSLIFPEELKSLYLNVFEIYMKHFDFSTWNQLSSKNIGYAYQICLLFLEIDFDRARRLKCGIGSLWKYVFSHLIDFSGYVKAGFEKHHDLYYIRLLNMEYNSTKYENNLKKAVECLELLEFLIDKQQSGFIFHLANLQDSCLSKELVCSTRIDLERKIALLKVSKLFEEKRWCDLVAIISDNILHAKVLSDCQNWINDLKTQFEIMLQSLWNMSDYEKCLIWSEKCLHYEVSKYMQETRESLRQNWAKSINYVFTYMESLILDQGYTILDCLGEYLSRLVQNIIRVLSFQLDSPYDKHQNPTHDLEIKRPWVVLHQVILREENTSPAVIKIKSLDSSSDVEEIEDLIPHSFLVLFTAHEFLGKRQWCTRDNGELLIYILDVITPNLRAPFYDTFRYIVNEYLEQVTYCLYGFPPKKARSRHIEDHESTPIEMSWIQALQLFDIYRPDCLPEFNSYKLESVSADMEQLLLKIVSLMSKEINTSSATTKILEYVCGQRNELPHETECIKLPFKVSCIYYLLADYYFKNREFSKTSKYYILDLACNPNRLDSWAGMALSKASKIETKLNDFLPIELASFLIEIEDTIRCFEQCIQLNQTQTLLWIEYGSFSYTIHSFYSRHLEHLSREIPLEQLENLEMQKENMLNIAYNCFTLAAALQFTSEENGGVDEESHEEKWLCQYMLGKISEKRKEQPKVYIKYYLTAAHYLYESNATYPIKINHSNPTPLSVEALEIFYRTNCAIIKFIEHEKKINRNIVNFFKNVLKKLSISPFAFNKAKIDGKINQVNV